MQSQRIRIKKQVIAPGSEDHFNVEQAQAALSDQQQWEEDRVRDRKQLVANESAAALKLHQQLHLLSQCSAILDTQLEAASQTLEAAIQEEAAAAAAAAAVPVDEPSLEPAPGLSEPSR